MHFGEFLHYIGMGPTKSHLSELPTEVLLEIAINVSERHTHKGYVIEASNLAALSSVSRRMRAVTLPLMHREVVVSSEKQLRALGTMSKDLLACVRELNMFLSVEFIETWRVQAFSDAGSGTVYDVLLHILSQMPRISALRMRVAELHGIRSGWGKFAMSHRNNSSYGIPIGRAIGQALRRVRMSRLSSLRTLEMDGFQDIELLVRLAPNLEELSMSMSGGFAPYVNAELVWALLGVPKLKKLTYTPTSLDLDEAVLVESKPSAGSDSREESRSSSGESSLRLLHVIGRLVPHLEELDLQTRVFDDEIEFRSRMHLIPQDALVPALDPFKDLHTLLLPSTVLSEEESASIRSPYRTFLSRRAAMLKATRTEATATRAIGASTPSLRRISFVRPADPNEWTHHAVSYPLNFDTAKTSRSELARQVTISRADEGQFAAWPYTHPVPLSVVLRKWWLAPSGAAGAELVLAYVADLDSVRAWENSAPVRMARKAMDVVERTRWVTMMLIDGAMYAGRHVL